MVKIEDYEMYMTGAYDSSPFPSITLPITCSEYALSRLMNQRLTRSLSRAGDIWVTFPTTNESVNLTVVYKAMHQPVCCFYVILTRSLI